MTTRYKTQAIIFKKNNINESDRSFSIFSDNFGRLNIFAKAIRKITSKLRGGIDIFYLSDIEFIQGKNKKTLTDANTIEKFSNISESIEKNKVALDIGEFLDNFIKGEERDQGLFDLLSATFYNLNDRGLKDEKTSLLYCYFLWNALSLLGYHSEVKSCAGCHGILIPDEVYFSGKQGGVICKKCFEKVEGNLNGVQKINSDVVKILRIILSKDWKTLCKLKTEQATQKLLLEVSVCATRSFCPANY
jgi:DNA repair protein RecO (recombination protein O)